MDAVTGATEIGVVLKLPSGFTGVIGSSLPDVEDHEQWQLPHVLFREFDHGSSIDEKLDHVAVRLRGLNNRIILSDSGTYEYAGIHRAGVRPIREQG